jgi:hypothetical protein
MRKPIGKKLRFAVFHRDGFTCQYCGASAPDVVLHCDHIHPVAKGGKNHLENLITACVDCNSGKGAQRLEDEAARAIHNLLQQGLPLISTRLLRQLTVIQLTLRQRFGGDEHAHMSELVQLHGFGIDLHTLEHFAARSETARKFWDDAIANLMDVGGQFSGTH